MLDWENLLGWETLILWHLVSNGLVATSSSAWERWKTALAQDTCNTPLPEICSNTLLSLLLCGDNRLRSCFPDQLLLCSILGVADGQELNKLWLADDAGTCVVAAVVALPVWVIGDVSSWESDSIIVASWVECARCRVAELWVQWDTVGAVWVDGQEAADALPNASGLDSVFLKLVSYGAAGWPK